MPKDKSYYDSQAMRTKKNKDKHIRRQQAIKDSADKNKGVRHPWHKDRPRTGASVKTETKE